MNDAQERREPDVEAREDPRIARSRAAIMAAALDHFVERGYRGGNIDDVAALAGVSKKTVYNVVGDKEQLFRAVILQAVRTAEQFSDRSIAGLGSIESLDPGLREASTMLARTVLTGPVIRLRRLLISEVESFPEFARDYYERAPGLVLQRLADALAGLAARGLLTISDPVVAAEHLAFLIMGAGLDRALFTPPSAAAPAPDEIDARADAGFDAFVRAYRPAAAPHTYGPTP